MGLCVCVCHKELHTLISIPPQTTFTFFLLEALICPPTACKNSLSMHMSACRRVHKVCSHKQAGSVRLMHKRYTNKQLDKLLGRQEPEWPIFSCFSLMSAIKSARHQYFSALVRRPEIFPFDEAHQRCFVFCSPATSSHVNFSSK